MTKSVEIELSSRTNVVRRKPRRAARWMIKGRPHGVTRSEHSSVSSSVTWDTLQFFRYDLDWFLIRWGPPIIGTGRSSIQFDGGTPFDKVRPLFRFLMPKAFGLENSWNSTPDIPETEPGISEHSSVPSVKPMGHSSVFW